MICYLTQNWLKGWQVDYDVCVCVCVCAHVYVCMSVAQPCLTLCYPMNCSPPGSSVYGILQARIVEWVALPFSRKP